MYRCAISGKHFILLILKIRANEHWWQSWSIRTTPIGLSITLIDKFIALTYSCLIYFESSELGYVFIQQHTFCGPFQTRLQCKTLNTSFCKTAIEVFYLNQSKGTCLRCPQSCETWNVSAFYEGCILGGSLTRIELICHLGWEFCSVYGDQIPLYLF